jgi:acetoin utilization deacetylase AcuC-like enzyme
MIPVFYSDTYVSSRKAFDTTRKAQWVAESLQNSPIAGIRLQEPRPATVSDLQLAHTDAYIRSVQTGTPRGLAASSGLGWDQGTFAAVAASTGGVIEAALHAVRTGGTAGTLSSGLHHASRMSGAGFCTFNGLAVAAAAAGRFIDQTGRAQQVLIVDLDAHPGDGTNDIIKAWPWVHQLDIALRMAWYTPEHVNTLDVVTRAGQYLPTLRDRLSELAHVPFDLLLFNAGMDPHEGCDIGGMEGITAALLRVRDHIVFEWARDKQIPVAFTLAGGYVGERLSKDALVDLHRQTIEAAVITNGKGQK